MNDTRNVIDGFKGMTEADIIAQLDRNGSVLEIAIENVERDFNMGTIVRSANAFGVRHVHIIGRRQWNKRGAMATDRYLHVHYHQTVKDFVDAMEKCQKTIIAIDNIPGAEPLSQTTLPHNAVLVFGAEGPGISKEVAESAVSVIAIEQYGSTRSINVGVAAGIVIYEWTRLHHIQAASNGL